MLNIHNIRVKYNTELSITLNLKSSLFYILFEEIEKLLAISMLEHDIALKI